MLITTAFDMLIIARAPNLAAGKRGAGGWWLVAGGWWLVAGGWWLVAGGWWEEWGTLERPEKKGVPPTIIRGPLRAAESAAVPVSSLWLQGNVASLQGSPRLFVSVAQITGEVKQITQK